MKSMESLFAFIPFFENATEKDICTWGGGCGLHATHCCTSAYPVYTKRFKEFIDATYDAGLIDEDYSLSASKLGTLQDNIDDIIGKADYHDIQILLTHIIRGERFRDGLWVQAFQNKTFAKILKRLQALPDLPETCPNSPSSGD
jgi:hypothetical protein